MKITEPSYYEKFRCIADRCSFTCCRDWKIAVDRKTLETWKKIPLPADMPGKKGRLADHVCPDMGDARIRLNDNGRCPFLNEQGLCRIVRQYGEGMISETCHTFPREEHKFADRTEKTLTMGCPAALELLWQCGDFEVCSRDEGRTDPEDGGKRRHLKDLPEADETLFLFRDRCVDLMCNSGMSVSDALKVIFFLALDCYEKDCDEQLSAAYVETVFTGGAFDDVVNAVRKVETDPLDSAAERNELFLDLAQNYRDKNIYSEVLEPLAALAEAYEDEEESFEQTKKLAAIGQEFKRNRTDIEDKVRLLTAEELFSTLVLPESDMYSLVLKLQWLGIFTAVLEDMLTLKWSQEHVLTDDEINGIVTVLIRMTGYSDDDIEEYLEDSFEEIIWDWGYMALIVS